MKINLVALLLLLLPSKENMVNRGKWGFSYARAYTRVAGLYGNGVASKQRGNTVQPAHCAERITGLGFAP